MELCAMNMRGVGKDWKNKEDDNILVLFRKFQQCFAERRLVC